MRRVVITGLGMVNALGCDVAASWSAMLAGRDGAGPITRFDTTAYDIHRAHEVRADWVTQARDPYYAILNRACQEAYQDSQVAQAAYAPERCGVIIGTLGGGLLIFEQHLRPPYAKQRAYTRAVAECYPLHTVVYRLAQEYTLAGPALMSVNACSAGNHALAQAYELFRTDRVDLMMVGGAECLTITAFTHFHNLKTLARERCAPFDRERDGLMIGEGAGVLILESWEKARQRGAHVYAEILGYGMSCDAYHMTGPHPEGDGAIRGMRASLQMAGLGAEDIDYISAHGTATPLNDKIETKAIKAVMGARAYQIPVSSVKSMIGHTMGAASAIESVVSCLAIKHQIVPPTINYQVPDPECDLDYVTNKARELPVRKVLNNSFAFGGNNVSVIFGQIE